MTDRTFDDRRADDVVELLRSASEIMRSHPGRRGAVDWIPARGRLLATGDLHDNPMHLPCDRRGAYAVRVIYE